MLHINIKEVKQLKREKQYKKLTALLLAGAMSLGLAACGGGKTPTEQTGTDSTFVYVPEWRTVSSGSDGWISSYAVSGGYLFYEQGGTEQSGIFSLALSDPSAEPTLVYDTEAWQAETDFQSYISGFFAASDGGVVILQTKYPVMEEFDYEEIQRNTVYTLRKLSADGTLVAEQDITEALSQSEDAYISYGATDADGNYYLSNGSGDLWVFDGNGSLLNFVQLGGGSEYVSINGMGLTADGSLAILQYGQNDLELKLYDRTKKALSDAYTGLPDSCYNSSISEGINGGVLLFGSSALYEYDLTTQTYTQLVRWLDCDMNGDYVESVMALEDGTLAALSRDWNSGEISVVLLKKVAASEVAQKQILTLACFGLSQSIQADIVSFNKTNPDYRITVKDYGEGMEFADENEYQSTYNDRMNQFLNDLVSGNAPDLIDYNTLNLDIEMLAEKGVLADLNPYLDASTVVNRADLIEPVLNAYTVDGNLYLIPERFSVRTLVGRTAEVGDEAGWSFDEMLALAEQYPDAQLYPGVTRAGFLSTCLSYDIGSYVNWETGECFFNSTEFKKVLTLAAKYPEKIDWQSEPSEPAALRTHQALLSDVTLDNPESWQVAQKMFDEPITPIGFPSASSTGVIVSGTSGICISAPSAYKEAAWSFIEQGLDPARTENDWMSWGFSTVKEVYDKEMQEKMVPNYQLDAEGNILLDENGNKLEFSNSSYGWADDVTIEIYAVTQEEADSIFKVIEQIGSAASQQNEFLTIIEEEAEPYFEGQKTVDEVADIIQSRIQIYVNETR